MVTARLIQVHTEARHRYMLALAGQGGGRLQALQDELFEVGARNKAYSTVMRNVYDL